MKCYACGKLVGRPTEFNQSPADADQGHISRDCTAPNGGPLNSAGKVCYKCGQTGHISRDCTLVETNGQPASDAAPPAPVPATVAPIADITPAPAVSAATATATVA